MGGCDGHAFGAVDGRAAAQGNQAVALVGVIHRDASTHGSFRGVGRRLVKHGHWQTGQGVECFLQNANRFDAGIGHDERSVDMGFCAFGPQSGEHAKVDLNVREVENLSHGKL